MSLTRCPRCGTEFRYSRLEQHWKKAHPKLIPWTPAERELMYQTVVPRKTPKPVAHAKPKTFIIRTDGERVPAGSSLAAMPAGEPRAASTGSTAPPSPRRKSAKTRPSKPLPNATAFQKKCCGTWFVSKASWDEHRRSAHQKKKPRPHVGGTDTKKQKKRATGIFGSIYNSFSGVVSGGLPGLGKRR